MGTAATMVIVDRSAIGVVTCPPDCALPVAATEFMPAFIELASSFCNSYCRVDNA